MYYTIVVLKPYGTVRYPWKKRQYLNLEIAVFSLIGTDTLGRYLARYGTSWPYKRQFLNLEIAVFPESTHYRK